jgi:hypothetical protein
MYLCITRVSALYAGTELMNEMSASRKKVGDCLSYMLVNYFNYMLAGFIRFFLCRPSNVSAPKVALRLSCCLQPGFMAKQE